MKLLFITEEELKEFLPTTASFRISTMATHLMRAQQRYIREALGFEQLQELVTAYVDSALTPELTELLYQVRGPLASYAYALQLPVSTSQLGSTGTTQASTNNVKPADPKTIALSREAYMCAGDEGIEALLEYLEENREKYPTWAASEACTVQIGQMLATARDFDKLVFIDRSRRRFRELQPALLDVERLALVPLMGSPLVEELKTQIQAGEVTALNKKLLDYVRPALANLAMRPDDFRVQQGLAYLDDLRLFLYDRADDYPLFTESGAYKPEVSTQLQQNTDWGFFGAL